MTNSFHGCSPNAEGAAQAACKIGSMSGAGAAAETGVKSFSARRHVNELKKDMFVYQNTAYDLD